jgi:hypothetical protein
MDESFFQGLGQPTGAQLERLPVWAATWIQSLKYDVIEAWHRRHKRHVTFPGRRRLTTTEEARCQDKINDLPQWAGEWIYTLRFEIWWQGQQATETTPLVTQAEQKTKKRTTLF